MWADELDKPKAAVEITSREFVGFHDAGADEIKKMGISGVVGTVNRASDDIGGLEIVGSFRVHLLDFDGFCDMMELSVGV